MTNTNTAPAAWMTAAVAKAVVCELAVNATDADAALAIARVAGGRPALAVETLGAAVAVALLRKEIKAWASRRARWAKAAKAA